MTAQYEAHYSKRPPATPEQRATCARVMREIWGDEWLVELGATNWIGWTELRRMAAELNAGTGETLVDLGCGSGGPGLWVAQQAGAKLVGVDNAAAGCAAARERALRKHAAIDARFIEADMASTTLAAASADALMSIDALQVAPLRAAAMAEIARVLRPHGRVVLTTWDHPDAVPNMPGREIVPDGRALLQAAGIRVLAYEPLPSWEQRALPTYRAMLAERDAFTATVGDWLIAEAEWGAAHGQRSAHVLIVAEWVV